MSSCAQTWQWPGRMVLCGKNGRNLESFSAVLVHDFEMQHTEAVVSRVSTFQPYFGYDAGNKPLSPAILIEIGR